MTESLKVIGWLMDRGVLGIVQIRISSPIQNLHIWLCLVKFSMLNAKEGSADFHSSAFKPQGPFPCKKKQSRTMRTGRECTAQRRSN